MVLRHTPLLWWATIDFCRLRCTATTTVTDLSNPEYCLPMFSAVFVYDDYHLVFPVVRFLAACRDGCHGRNHDNLRRLTVHNKNSRRTARTLICCHILFVCFRLSLWYAKLHPVAFSKAWLAVLQSFRNRMGIPKFEPPVEPTQLENQTEQFIRRSAQNVEGAVSEVVQESFGTYALFGYLGGWAGWNYDLAPNQ